MNRKRTSARAGTRVVLPLQTSGGGGRKIVVRGLDGTLRVYDSWDEVPATLREKLGAFQQEPAGQAGARNADAVPGGGISREGVEVVYRWFNLGGVLLYGFVTALGGSVLGLRLFVEPVGRHLPTPILWLGGLMVLGPGTLLLATILNRTTIKVRRDELVVRHGPVPWPGRTLPMETVVQIFVTITHLKRGPLITLEAAVKEGVHERYYTLIPSIHSRGEAARLERELEAKLGIEDWPGYNAENWAY